MECPRCDGQGILHKVIIKKIGEKVWLCDECDALWPLGAPISKRTFHDFSTYVKRYRLKGTWDEVEPLCED